MGYTCSVNKEGYVTCALEKLEDQRKKIYTGITGLIYGNGPHKMRKYPSRIYFFLNINNLQMLQSLKTRV